VIREAKGGEASMRPPGTTAGHLAHKAPAYGDDCGHLASGAKAVDMWPTGSITDIWPMQRRSQLAWRRRRTSCGDRRQVAGHSRNIADIWPVTWRLPIFENGGRCGQLASAAKLPTSFARDDCGRRAGRSSPCQPPTAAHYYGDVSDTVTAAADSLHFIL